MGAALGGLTLPSPVAASGGGTATLPPGAAEITCNYHAATYNVLVQILTDVDPSTTMAMFTARFPAAAQTVTGVGDQARSFVVPLDAGRDNEAVVATKGRTLVAVTATSTPATLAQVGALVNQLL
ncbi:MAG: hypothetical protein ACREN2_09415 [Candidatus Dormibacteria bacterium]